MAVEVGDDALLLFEAALKFEKLVLLFRLALDVFLGGLLVDLLEDECLGREWRELPSCGLRRAVS